MKWRILGVLVGVLAPELARALADRRLSAPEIARLVAMVAASLSSDVAARDEPDSRL